MCLDDGCGCGGHGFHGGGDDCCSGGAYESDYEMGGYDVEPPATAVPTPAEANPFKDDPGSGAPQARNRRTVRPTGAVLQAVPRAPRGGVNRSAESPRSFTERSAMVRKSSASVRNAGTTKSIRSAAAHDGRSVRRGQVQSARMRNVDLP
jgi:hypothetical protein